MHKGIHLSIKLWIEGEDEPAHDYSAYTMQAIKDILAAGAALYPDLKISIRSIREDKEWEEEENEDH